MGHHFNLPVHLSAQPSKDWEHPEAPAPDPAKPTAVVTVVEVESIDNTLALAAAAGAPVSETVTDVTPEGMRFSEAMITSPGGHAILVYELGNAP